MSEKYDIDKVSPGPIEQLEVDVNEILKRVTWLRALLGEREKSDSQKSTKARSRAGKLKTLCVNLVDRVRIIKAEHDRLKSEREEVVELLRRCDIAFTHAPTTMYHRETTQKVGDFLSRIDGENNKEEANNV